MVRVHDHLWLPTSAGGARDTRDLSPVVTTLVLVTHVIVAAVVIIYLLLHHSAQLRSQCDVWLALKASLQTVQHALHAASESGCYFWFVSSSHPIPHTTHSFKQSPMLGPVSNQHRMTATCAVCKRRCAWYCTQLGQQPLRRTAAMAFFCASGMSALMYAGGTSNLLSSARCMRWQ